MTEGAEKVACACNKNPNLAATVWISGRNEDKKKNTAEIKSKEKTQIAARTEKNEKDKVKFRTVIKEKVQITARNQEQKTTKMPDESYQDILVFRRPAKFCSSKEKLQRTRRHRILFVMCASSHLCL